MNINSLIARKIITVLFFVISIQAKAQTRVIYKDSIVKRIIYRDTIIYKHDTVKLRHFIYTDTVRENTNASPIKSVSQRKRKMLNPNSWGIGPTLGAYYSPINGFDVNIGFGIQYYILSVPSFRNPHMKHAKNH
jgi:hypothetical protein